MTNPCRGPPQRGSPDAKIPQREYHSRQGGSGERRKVQGCRAKTKGDYITA